MAQKNSPGLWKRIYTKQPHSAEEDWHSLKKLEASVVWQRMEKVIKSRFPSFEKLRVVEVGSGRGEVSALFALRGSEVTLLDYTQAALDKAKLFYGTLAERSNRPLKVNYLLADVLNLPNELIGSFDVAMSFGLSEHFTDAERRALIENHVRLTGSGGISFNSVPNARCIPYRIFKFFAELLGAWSVGEEFPFTRSELRNLAEAQRRSISKDFFIGSSFWESFKFLNPLLPLYYYTGIRPKIRTKKVPPQRGTGLDEYLGYALIYTVVKK